MRKDLIPLVVLVVGVFVLVLMLVGMAHRFQMRGETPPYTCAPGTAHTLKECP